MYNQSIQIINKLRNQFDRKLKNNNSYKDNNLYNASENYYDTTNMYDMTPTQMMRTFQMGGAPQGQPQAQPNPSSDYMQQLMQKVGGQGQPQEPMQQPDQAAQGMPSNEELVQMFQQLPPEMQEQIKQMPPQQQPQAIMQAFEQVQAQGQQPMQEEMVPASPEEMAQMTPAEQMACGGMVKKKDFAKVNLPKADFGKDLGAGLYGAGEGLLDTLSMGATDGLTDMGYTALQGAAGSTDAEKKQQNAIRGYSALAGNVTGAIINPAATSQAFSQGAKNLNTGLQNTNGVSDDVKKWSGTLLPVAGKIGGMAAGSAGGGAEGAGGMDGATGGFDFSKLFGQAGKAGGYSPKRYGGKLRAYQEGGEVEQDDSQEQNYEQETDDFEFEYRDLFDKLDADTQDSIMEQVLQYPNEQQDRAMKQAVANVMQQKQQQAREQQMQQRAQQQAQQQEAERQALEAKAQGRNPEEEQGQQQYQQQEQQPQEEAQYGEERDGDEGYYRNGGNLIKAQGGLDNPRNWPQPTYADSMALVNDTENILRMLRGRNYNVKVEKAVNAGHIHRYSDITNESIIKKRNQNHNTFISKQKSSSPLKSLKNLDYRYDSPDKPWVYYQRELDWDVINEELPKVRYDRRITPSLTVTAKSTDSYPYDDLDIPLYDVNKVMPYAEKVRRGIIKPTPASVKKTTTTSSPTKPKTTTSTSTSYIQNLAPKTLDLNTVTNTSQTFLPTAGANVVANNMTPIPRMVKMVKGVPTPISQKEYDQILEQTPENIQTIRTGKRYDAKFEDGGNIYNSNRIYKTPKANIQQVLKGPYAESTRENILRQEYLNPNETVQAYLKHQQGDYGYSQIAKGTPPNYVAKHMKANIADEMKPGFDKLTPLAKAATFIDFWNHKTNTLEVPNNDITKAIRQAAKKNGANPDLYVKMAMLESTLNPEAVSESGEHIGIQQIAKKYMSNPDHAKDPAKATQMAIRLAKNQFKNGKLDYGFEPVKTKNTQANYNPGDMVQFEMGGKIHSRIVKSYNKMTGDLDLI